MTKMSYEECLMKKKDIQVERLVVVVVVEAGVEGHRGLGIARTGVK